MVETPSGMPTGSDETPGLRGRRVRTEDRQRGWGRLTGVTDICVVYDLRLTLRRKNLGSTLLLSPPTS